MVVSVEIASDVEGELMGDGTVKDVGSHDDPHEMERTSLKLVRWQKRALEKMGIKDGRSVNDLVRQAVSEFLEKRVGRDVTFTETQEQPDVKGN
jgi:hypothetical protein